MTQSAVSSVQEKLGVDKIVAGSEILAVVGGSLVMQDNGDLSAYGGRMLRIAGVAIGHNTGREQGRLLECLPPWSG